MQRHFTATEVADLCDMTRDGIHKARRKQFPNVKKDVFSGMYKFPRGDVREYLLTEHGIVLEEAEEARENERKAQTQKQ